MMNKEVDLTIQGEILRNVYSYYIEHKKTCIKYYDAAESKNFDRLYEDISIADAEKEYPKVAIVILTANKYERNVLHSINYSETRRKIKRFDIQLFSGEIKVRIYGFLFEWHDYLILNLHASAKGSYPNGGSADIVRYIGTKKNLLPMTVISCGICFGVDHISQNLGNTYLAEKVYSYFVGSKITKSKFFASDDNMYRTNEHLLHKLKGRYFDVNKSKTIFDKNTPEFDFKPGVFITGEAVVSNQEFRDLFVQVTTEEVSAGEMEAYGMYKECAFLGIPCLTIKSICDWGVAKNDSCPDLFIQLNGSPAEKGELESMKDRIQAITSANAAKAVSSLLNSKMLYGSIYGDIKKYLLNNYGETGVFFDTITSFCVDYLQEKMIVDNETIWQFAWELVKTLKLDNVLYEPENECNENMWMINMDHQ